MSPEPPPTPTARRRPSRLLTALLIVLAVSGWVACLARKDEARARPCASVVFHLARTPPTLMSGAAERDQAEFEAFRTTEAAILRRRATLKAVLNQPSVASLGLVTGQRDPLGWLDDGLRVSFDGPELMRAELDGEDEAVAVLGALARVYLAAVDERQNATRRVRLSKLEEKHRTFRAEAERFDKRLNTIVIVLGARNVLTQTIADSVMADELRAALSELNALRQQMALLEAQKDGGGPEGKQLAVRLGLAKARVEEVQKSISKSSEYRQEQDNLRQLIAQTEALNQRLGEEIERLKIELDAPPRVTLFDEPHVRTPKR